MKNHRVEILPAAWDDLREIGEYIAQDSPAADRMVENIIGSLRRLEQFPLSAPLVPNPDLAREGYRGLVCGAYISFYRPVSESVFVYHVIHGARNYSVLFEKMETEDKQDE